MEWRQNSRDRAAVPMLIMKNLHPVCGSEVYVQAAFQPERYGLRLSNNSLLSVRKRMNKCTRGIGRPASW
jgi:hypothetical protein